MLERRHAILPAIHERVASQLAVVREWIELNETFEWIEPQARAVCFPRFRADVELDVDRFYRVLFEEHGTYVGGGHWFDQDRRFFRVGFAWPGEDELVRGLRALDEAAAAALRPPGVLSR